MHRHRLPRETGGALSLETFKVRLHRLWTPAGTVGVPIVAEELDQIAFKISFQLSDPMTLW